MIGMGKEQRVTYWEEAKSLANMACWAIELQVKRLQRLEAEIPDFPSRPVVDFLFLMTAISRLRKAADLAYKASDISTQIREFDNKMPMWREIRNDLEHIDKRWQKQRRGEKDESIKPGSLPVIQFDGQVVHWQSHRLDLRAAMEAAYNLFLAIEGIWPFPDEGSW